MRFVYILLWFWFVWNFNSQAVLQILLFRLNFLIKSILIMQYLLIFKTLFISRFAHLINLEFYQDLVSILSRLMVGGELDLHQQLLCIQTVFTILSGYGETLNIDPTIFYTHLYRNILSIHAGWYALTQFMTYCSGRISVSNYHFCSHCCHLV